MIRLAVDNVPEVESQGNFFSDMERRKGPKDRRKGRIFHHLLRCVACGTPLTSAAAYPDACNDNCKRDQMLEAGFLFSEVEKINELRRRLEAAEAKNMECESKLERTMERLKKFSIATGLKILEFKENQQEEWLVWQEEKHRLNHVIIALRETQ